MTYELKTIVLYNGTILSFSAQQAAIFASMALCKERVLTRSHIYNLLYWDHRDDEGPNPKIIDVIVCKLRVKIRDMNLPVTIETIWGRGYRLRVLTNDSGTTERS